MLFGNSFIICALFSFGVNAYLAPVYNKANPSLIPIYAKPKPAPKISKNVEKYLMMKEVKKLKESGESYDSIKASIAGNTSESTGYKKFVGKGTLDQRLRAVISYKRGMGTGSTDASTGYSSAELMELEGLDAEDEDEDEYLDDEERDVESQVLEILQQNKLNALKQTLDGNVPGIFTPTASETDSDSASASPESPDSSSLSSSSSSLPLSSDTDPSTSLSESQSQSQSQSQSIPSSTNNTLQELYTPKSSAWGLFERPKDISKTFGGGRVISREEIRAMDAAAEVRRQQEKEATKWMSESMQTETENKGKIQDALERGRGRLQMGDRQGAVTVLESVQELVSWQSEFGGDLLLELAMALETVDRADEARSMYGRLASKSWSAKIRRQALQLLQGLDITKKLRQDPSGKQKPIMELQYMEQISEKLKEGLTNEWDDYKKKPRKKKPVPWYEDDKKYGAALERVERVEDAYYLLLKSLNPLKKVPSEALHRAVRMMYLTPAQKKLEFLHRRMEAETPQESKVMRTPNDEVYEDEYGFIRKRPKKKPVREDNMGVLFGKSLNGSWDLVFTLQDKRPYSARRFESGSMRRKMDGVEDPALRKTAGFFSPPTTEVTETEPVFWGMGESSALGTTSWNAARCELTMCMRDGRKALAPAVKPGPRQTIQILWVDSETLVSRQSSDRVGDPDLYSVWKKLRPVKYIKF